ncbi:hypothetical protein BDW59DRAFT_12192 [Aspergillus cavernicola]|uniref:BZIP domain-containing protein n=1 Tax=Aspergillus cavernicola TaxID=176166 RepID=A0ABR4HMY6_9EURO
MEMETDFYSSLNWALTTDPGESLFPWDSSARLEPADEIWADPELDLLLSASSYPVPEASQLQDHEEQQHNHSPPLFGGLVVQHGEQTNKNSSQSGDTASTPKSPKHRRQPPGEPVKKRGRPRKLLDDGGAKPEERRRMQVRMAQRAYRSRKEASVSSLKERINQLEGAVKQMGTAVISFGDDLVRSGALESYPDLLKPLGNTVQACLALPTIPHGEPDYQLELPDTTSGGQKKQMLAIYPSPSSPGKADTMEVSEFVDRLHVTCTYQAYLACANPAVPQRRLERSFRMLLSFMPRALIAEYFKDLLLARAGHKTLDHWDHIPLFQIGGAGTHYSVSYNAHYPFAPHSKPSAVETNLSQILSSAEIVKEFDDVWFDLGDLVGYLRERQVVFPAMSPMVIGLGSLEPGHHPSSSVTRLIHSLLRNAFCLGRSPGFRRRDVERALDDFEAYSTVSST